MHLEPGTQTLEPALPWYRHKLVWLVIAIPAASVFAGMFMNYLAINQSLQRDRSATELGLGAQLVVEETGDMVSLYFNKGSLAEYPDQLTLHVQHATHAGHDQVLTLIRAPQDQYIGYLKHSIKEGDWHIMLSTEEWRLVNRIHWQNGLNINLVSQE